MTRKYSPKEYLIFLLKFLCLLPLQIIHLFTFLFPRDKSIWVFGSWNGNVFFDNSKYLYLNIYHNYPSKLSPIWISENKMVVKQLQDSGYKSYYAWSAKGLFYCFRAKFYFIDHKPGNGNFFSPINLWLSGFGKM